MPAAATRGAVVRTRGHLSSQVERRLAERGHALGPVFPIPVGNKHGNGASYGAPEAHAGNHLRRIALDLHTPTSAVAYLAAR